MVKTKVSSDPPVEDFRRITLTEYGVTGTSAPPPDLGSGDPDVVGRYKARLRTKFVKKTGMDLEFDLVGVDPAIANAIRRLLLSDIPSMAIEKVYVYNNTSIIQDEVLAHRLGMIPLKADPRNFEWYKSSGENLEETFGNEKNTLEFELKVRCRKNPEAPTDSENPDDLYIDHKVYTKNIKWIPRKGQFSKLSDGKETTPNPGPVEDDILIAKMRPGHELDIKLFAVKGVGRDHAKFSPVCTAFYRLMPEIILKKPIFGEAAERLQKCFSPGVIDFVSDKVNGKKAVVKDARYDACSRNVFRHDDLKDAVTLNKIPDHFIFTVESAGAMQPEDLVMQAIDLLAEKAAYFLKELDAAIK